MKKILSLTLAALILVSMIPTAMAADYTEGTQITLNGSGTESYTVTVPAAMSPGDTGTVRAEGTWAADKVLNVVAPKTVTLAYGAQTMDVAITCNNGSNVPSSAHNGFYLIGNSVDSVSKEAEISVAEASRLFGTWEGKVVYTVELIQKGDINQDGVIDLEDYNLLAQSLLSDNTLTEEQQALANANGDVDGDGQIIVRDRMVLSMIVQENGFVIE